jgi:hypothetical protein
MKSKTSIAAVAALGTLILAASPVAHAGSQDDWLMQQLQITDGYAYNAQGKKDAAAFDRSAAAPATSGDRAQSEWVIRQLQITDGYAPVDGVQGVKNAVASEPDGTGPTVVADRARSEWAMQQLQITDGYAPPPVARAKDETRTSTFAYQGAGTTQN